MGSNGVHVVTMKARIWENDFVITQSQTSFTTLLSVVVPANSALYGIIRVTISSFTTTVSSTNGNGGITCHVHARRASGEGIGYVSPEEVVGDVSGLGSQIQVTWDAANHRFHIQVKHTYSGGDDWHCVARAELLETAA